MQLGMASSSLEPAGNVGHVAGDVDWVDGGIGQGQPGADGSQGQPGADVGGEGGSRAWVGRVRRRDWRKNVVRVDGENGALRSFRCSAMDDKIEVL